MLKITEENIRVNGHIFDYRIEDGTLLHESEWNGEDYTVRENGKDKVYKPVYSETENENGGFDIIGFDLKEY